MVFFAGALAHHDLWRDVIAQLDDRYRCIAFDLPLGSHPWPMSPGADLSAHSLARLMLECLGLINLRDATVVVNDTAGALAQLALASDHPALGRVGRVVLTNCPSHENFMPHDGYRASAWDRALPGLARVWRRFRSQRHASSPSRRHTAVAALAATDIDEAMVESFYGPLQNDRRIAEDFVTVMSGIHPRLLGDAAPALARFTRPVLVLWGDECERYRPADACRLALEFPDAAVKFVPGAKTWVPVDDPAAVAAAIAAFAPAP